MIVTISITADHVRRANRLHGTKLRSMICPVALALSDILRSEKVHRVSVGATYFDLYTTKGLVNGGELPASVQAQIARYDSGQPIEPFSFQVSLPDDLIHFSKLGKGAYLK